MINKKTGCEYEPEVVKSSRAGFSRTEINEHLKICDDCRETARIMQFFAMNSANEPASKRLPSAGLIWWKSQLQQRRTANEKIGQPLMIAQAIAVSSIFLALVGILIYQPASFSSLADVLSRTLDVVEQFAEFLIIGLISLALIIAILSFTMFRSMTEK